MKKCYNLWQKGYEPLIYLHAKNIAESKAFELEGALIETIGRRDLGTGSLLNLTDGGGGVSGWIATEGWRQKQRARFEDGWHPNLGRDMSGSNSPTFGKKFPNKPHPQKPMLNRRHSEETKAIMRQKAFEREARRRADRLLGPA